MDCPCGASTTYEDHCGVLHQSGAGLGASAEQLMRARDSAYVLGNRDFLLDTWHESTQPDHLNFDPNVEWVGPTIVATEGGAALDSTGIVEFEARFLRNGEPLTL